MDDYFNSLENQMKHVFNQLTALVRKGKEIANGMFEFGLAFVYDVWFIKVRLF